MQKEKEYRMAITLLGITTRTNNKDEMDPSKAKIGGVLDHYFGNQIANQFKHRIKPGVTYAVYTEYESDEHGEYTYFVGEHVTSLDDQDLSQFKSLIIPAGAYQKFTTAAGKMPGVVINAWQDIWKMDETELGGQRRYAADFELYDERAANPNRTVVDIHIGLQNF